MRLGLLALVFVACSTGERVGTPAASPAAPDAGEVPEAEVPTEAGADVRTPSDAPSDGPCAVSPVPPAVRSAFSLAAFYTKYVDAGGMPIVSSAKTPDRALCVARDVVGHMLEERPEIPARLAGRLIRLSLMAATERTTDIPEHSDLTPKDYWDQRARGLGATLGRPAVSAAEENVLCYANDRYIGESILVHEFSHTVLNIGVELDETTMTSRVQAAYDAAMAAGRFASTYAATNADEYWAEGAQDWFDTNLTRDPPDGNHGPIHTRAQLKTYDPALAGLLTEVFGDRTWRYACPAR